MYILKGGLIFMPQKIINSIRIHGMCIIYPNNRAVMPNSEIEFVDTCKELGLELNIKSNIIRSLEKMYDHPIYSPYSLNGQNRQPLYRELEKIIQNMPEYIQMKEEKEAERKKKSETKNKKVSPIMNYIIEQKLKKKKSLTMKMMRRHN